MVAPTTSSLADHPSRGELLLVDDSAASLAFLSAVLESAGYTVREAPSGELALMTLQVRQPELVLLDVRMPAMDGFEVCRRLKADAATRDIPVIFLSAQDETTDKVHGLDVGAVDFIGKNFAHEEMLARIDTHIALSRVKKALEQERATLEERVHERTEAQLKLERSLWQARKMEIVGQLAGGIAHDFNHLLSLILGYVQFAQAALTSGKFEKLENYLDEVFKAATQSQTVVAKLLTFSRAEEMSDEAIDIAPTVAEALDSLRPVLGNDITLQRQVPAGLAEVFLKPGQVKQLVANLVLNSCDALAGTGTIDIRLFVEQRSASLCTSCRKPFEGHFLVLSVTDSGPGIAAKLLDKIFDPFFTTKDIGKGTGLGLPVVHGIVHAVGGHIQTESEAGQGARFLLCIPVRQCLA